MNFDSSLRSALASWPATSPREMARVQVAFIAACGAFTGALMGSYAAWNGGSPLFALWAALKVPLLLGVSGALCFPLLRVLSFLLGVSGAFSEAARSLLGVSATLASVLAALSPLTLVVYASGANYRGALLWNIGVWTFAALVALWRARRDLSPLLQRNVRLRTLGAWGFVLWAFVAVQLSWCLRPYIGRPDAPPQFLRADAFSNAYVELWKALTLSPGSSPTRRGAGS